MINHMTIIGLGTIGQSIASAIRQSDFCKTIVGFDKNQKLQAEVVANNLIDKGALDLVNAVKMSDFIVLALPYCHYEEVLSAIANTLKPHAVITDTAAIKSPVVEKAKRILKDKAAYFVPSHPVVSTSDILTLPVTDLFASRPMIVTPFEGTHEHALEVVSHFWSMMGGEIEIMTPGENDALLASTCHLPQLLAFTFVHSIKNKDSLEKYISKNFKDFTSIATHCPITWRDLCIANRQAIIKEISDFENSLGKIKKILESEETDTLLKHFNDAKQLRENL